MKRPKSHLAVKSSIDKFRHIGPFNTLLSNIDKVLIEAPAYDALISDLEGDFLALEQWVYDKTCIIAQTMLLLKDKIYLESFPATLWSQRAAHRGTVRRLRKKLDNIQFKVKNKRTLYHFGLSYPELDCLILRIKHKNHYLELNMREIENKTIERLLDLKPEDNK